VAKQNWIELQAEFLIAHKETGIKVADWCAEKGLNYSSARRHIKLIKVKAKIRTKAKQKIVNVNNTANTIKHGGYSKYFTNSIGELVEGTNLHDELSLCRSRIHLVVCTIEEIQRRLADKKDKPSPEAAASYFESLLKADYALDKNVARVESITKTLSSIRIDNVNERKIVADTRKSNEITKATVINAKKAIVQTELIELQIQQARKEAGGTSKLDDYIDELTSNKVDRVVG